ncbi:MAG: hypothetical protein ACI97K_003294 [Glaciecola sp.]|jgi:hypothetical protein
MLTIRLFTICCRISCPASAKTTLQGSIASTFLTEVIRVQSVLLGPYFCVAITDIKSKPNSEPATAAESRK